MSVDSMLTVQPAPVASTSGAAPVMDLQDMKRILMLGIRGEIALPKEDHEVDVYA